MTEQAEVREDQLLWVLKSSSAATVHCAQFPSMYIPDFLTKNQEKNATSITFSAKQKQILSHQSPLILFLTYQESVLPKHLG